MRYTTSLHRPLQLSRFLRDEREGVEDQEVEVGVSVRGIVMEVVVMLVVVG